MKKLRDPVENIIYQALIKSGLRFTRESQHIRRENMHPLDFHLTDLDIYIEVKQFASDTDRVSRQLRYHPNIILVQSVKAAEFFAKTLQAYGN